MDLLDRKQSNVRKKWAVTQRRSARYGSAGTTGKGSINLIRESSPP